MKDKESVECLIHIEKGSDSLFFLIVVINRLICIGVNIKLDTFIIFSISIGE